MVEYPLVIRNNVPLYQRCFMLAFLLGVALITYVCLRDGLPEPHRWWPLILSAFWLCGLFGLLHAFNQELPVIRITSAGNILISRGRGFRRE